MAKFLITYKIETVNHQIVEVEEASIMEAILNSRKRAKALTENQSSSSELPRTSWDVVEVKALEGENTNEVRI